MTSCKNNIARASGEHDSYFLANLISGFAEGLVSYIRKFVRIYKHVASSNTLKYHTSFKFACNICIAYMNMPENCQPMAQNKNIPW